MPEFWEVIMIVLFGLSFYGLIPSAAIACQKPLPHESKAFRIARVLSLINLFIWAVFIVIGLVSTLMRL